MFEDFGLLELSLSTFLGFISALLVEYLVDAFQDRKRLKNALQGITEELLSVSRAIKVLDDGHYIDPLETPFWDSLIYGDGPNTKLKRDMRQTIVSVYRQIEAANNWENIRTNVFYMTQTRNQELDDRVRSNRANLLEQLSRTIGVLKREIGTKEHDELPLP